MGEKYLKQLYFRMGVLVAFSLAVSLDLLAQSTQERLQPSAEERAMQMTQHLKQLLYLNEQQTRRVAEINERAAQEIETTRMDESLTNKDRRRQIHRLQVRRSAEIRALLTVPQRTRYDQYQKARQAQLKYRQEQRPIRQKDGRKGS